MSLSWFSWSYWFPTSQIRVNTLFHRNVDSSHQPCNYRIPAVYCFGDYIFAFCEQRLDTVKDHGRMNVAMRRISKSAVDANDTENSEWENFVQLPEVEGFRTMNPCPVGCSASGTLFLLVSAIRPEIHESEVLQGQTKEDFKIMITQSIDYGKTWSDWRDITYSMKENLPVGSKFHMVGPGHGIELSSGRLAVQGFFYRSLDSFSLSSKTLLPNRFFKPPYMNVGCCLCLTSDDQGTTWKLSTSSNNFVHARENGYFLHMGECSIVELRDKRLLLNSREYGSGQARILSQSDDAGDSWMQGYTCPRLNDPTNRGCKGGITKVTDGEDEYLVASNCGHVSSRKNLTLWMSKDGGNTWSNAWTVKPKEFGGYSDIDSFKHPETGQNFIVITYETGVSAYNERIDYLIIDFKRCLAKCQYSK